MQTLVNDGENVDFENSVKNVVNTYTTAELNNLGQINEPRDCGIYVFLFIKKADVQKVFDSRKKLVQSLYDTANDLAKDLNYGSALKYYYFANLLLNSIPETSIEYRGKNLSIDIPHKITSIIEETRFQIIKNDKVSDQKREITFRVTVDGNPVKSLDYKFFDGHSQVFANSRDGISRITLVGSSTRWDELTLTVKYKYYENREEIAAVGQLWGIVSAYNAKITQKIRLDEPIALKQEEIGIADAFTNQNLLITNSVGEVVTSNDITVNSVSLASQIVDIKKSIPDNLNKLKGYFNSNISVPEWELDDFLSKKLTQMKRFNNLELIDKSTRQNINNTYEGWEFRQLTGNTHYPSVNLRSNEYLVPDFDSTGKLVDVNFGTLDGLYDQFKRASTFGDDWDKRQVIVKFVEKYRTAYMTRDIDQLGTMFADEAVIIVGRVLQVDENDDKDFVLSKTNKNQPTVEYLQQTKKEFLTRQQNLFNTKRDIHLGFTSFDIRKKIRNRNLWCFDETELYFNQLFG